MTVRLSAVQRQIVQHGDGALLVVAGPGSGKTRVITERVRRLITESEGHFRVLAVTFTNKAANEMRERLDEFPDIGDRAFIGTFHSFCLEALASRGESVGIHGPPIVFESFGDRAQILREAVTSDPVLSEILDREPSRAGDLVSRWLSAISLSKASLQTAEEVADATVRRAYEAYDQELRANGGVDFDDLLLLTYRLFIQRPSIADFYRRQYRYICVDEAQDINAAQFYLLIALCGEDYRNVMMVGDPKQAIFTWNGADVRFLDTFVEMFNATEVTMTENFRSCQAVVTAAQALVSDYHVEGSLPVEGEVRILVGEDEEDEARRVTLAIDALLKDGHPDIEGNVTLDRCAVIARTRFALDHVEAQIQSLGWPYHKQLSAQHESESEIVRDFELGLRVLGNPRDHLHLRLLLNRWGSAGAADLEQLANPLNCLVEQASGAKHRVVVEALRAVDTPGAIRIDRALDVLETHSRSLSVPEARALVVQDIELWRKHWDAFLRGSHGGNPSLPAFLSDVALGTTQQPNAEGVALMTVHSAKGLEFDVVAVVGLAEGIFPDYRAAGPAMDEERRSAFVAVTRARRLLFLSYPRVRMMPWGDPRTQQPSRFLNAVAQRSSS